jgi:hypothetical protein
MSEDKKRPVFITGEVRQSEGIIEVEKQEKKDVEKENLKDKNNQFNKG